MINVLQKKIQGGDALRETVFNPSPFVVRNDSREQIVGENSLCALVISINRERNSLVQKREVRRLLTFAQLFRRKFQQSLEQSLVVIARRAWRGEHLIVKRSQIGNCEMEDETG